MRIEGETALRLIAVVFVVAGLASGAWLGLKHTQGFASPLDRIENLTLDWRFLLAGPRPAPPGVAIVAIDDETVTEAEGHAVSRELLARIVRAIVEARPRAVALDFAFPDPKGEQADEELAAALKSTASVVASIGIFGQDERSAEEPQSADFTLAPKPSQVLWPIDPIKNAAETGLANVSTDSSGVPRYVPMLFEPPDTIVPSFVLAAASAAAGADPVIGPDTVKVAGRTTVLDLGYHLPIRYYGPSGSFAQLSAVGLLRGDIDLAPLRGQLVLVGLTASGFGDTFATPFDRVAPGVEIVATAVSNLLSGETLARTRSTRQIDAAMAAGLPAAMIGLMAMRRAAVGLVVAALVFILWALFVFLLHARLLAQRRPAADDDHPPLRRICRRPLPRRAAGGKAARVGKGHAGQVSVAHSGRSPPPAAAFSRPAGPAGRRGDVPRFVRFDRHG